MAVEKLEQVRSTRASEESRESGAGLGRLQGAAARRAEGPTSVEPSTPAFTPARSNPVGASRELGEQWAGINGSGRESGAGNIPFFAHFLEGQKPDREGIQTLAYPSDSDADTGRPPGGEAVTMAYPSDSDLDTGTRPPGGEAVTMAYPSDSDLDTGTRPPGGEAVTMAYPSDSDRDCGCHDKAVRKFPGVYDV